MIAMTLLSLMISGSSDQGPALALGYRDNKPYIFTVSDIGSDRSNNNLYLNKEAAIHFNQMSCAALASGIKLEVNYGYRTREQQNKLRRMYGSLAAKAGTSPHQRGVAVDIHKTNKSYRWLVKHGKEFGFFADVKHESWHWSYHQINGVNT